LSGLPEDLEGSGYDLDGSGSGVDPDQEGTNNKPGPATVSDPGKENTNTAKVWSILKDLTCFVAFNVVHDAGNNAVAFCFALEVFKSERRRLRQACHCTGNGCYLKRQEFT
ncbi:hypothetical protein ILYODFUR_010994, partial [Ilyodon furcidens]